METLEQFQFLQSQLLGISLIDIILAFSIILAGFFSRKIILLILGKLIHTADQSRFRYDGPFLESLSRPLGWITPMIAVYLASLILHLPSEPIDLNRFAAALFRASWILLGIWMALRLYEVVCDIWGDLAARTETVLDDQLVPILRKSGRVFLVLLGLVLFVQNMGYSVGSLIASLGLGGAALALASKDTLANLFGSLVIFFDRPFQIGDWIEVEHIEGTVEDVGLRTIRIRTFSNSVITVPNSFFTTSIVNNWSRMEKRRIKMTIGLTYSTSAEQMKEAVKGIKTIILEDERLRHDFFLVNFTGFGASSLNILVYCFTKTTVWQEFMDIQEEFLLKIMLKLEDLGLDFAFPTQTLHLKTPDDSLQSGELD
ncbi:MAG: mechanosensitive ion channel family protein [SAR324 cluster bacterium]|nr:mechanosensitive ion channel family protein [SAR324 cluster bacterium]